MPRYISKSGMWYAAKERVALKNLSGKTRVVDGKEVAPNDDYIYEGADRAALFDMYKAGVETFGIDFHHDPELIWRVKQLGYDNVDDYAKASGYDPVKAEEEFNRLAAVVSKHELPEKVAAIETLGGGADLSGSNKSFVGGFGEEHLKPKE